jgi:hypothetical protein
MQRREAVGLFREICECIPDPSIFNSVFLMTQKIAGSEKENFELRINAAINDNNLKRLEFIVKKHGMLLMENKGSIIIYEPESTQIEIIA